MKNCTLLLLRKENKVLLAMKKRGFGAGRYNGVGGKIHDGETIEQALLRECREEIGVVPMNYNKVALHHFVKNTNEEMYDFYVHVYVCDEWQGEPIETEEMAPEWFDVIDVPYASMWPDDEFWLPQVLNGEKVEARFEFGENDIILSHNVQVVENIATEV